MKKTTLLLLFLLGTMLVHAQWLDSPLVNRVSIIPEVSIVIYDTEILEKDINICFTSLDVSNYVTNEPSAYGASFQICPIKSPGHPKLFAGLINNPNTWFFERFIVDFRVHPNNKYSIYSRYKELDQSFNDFYLILELSNENRFEVIDTFYGFNEKIDFHSFIIDESGNYWYMETINNFFDMSAITGREKDTAAIIVTTAVGVYDPEMDEILFRKDFWADGEIAIDEIPLSFLMENILDDSNSPIFDITHPNSFYPLDSINGCVIGGLSDLLDGIKIVNLCDSTSLRYGASSSNFTILDTTEHKLYKQHDFKKIKRGKYKDYYTCFNNGDNTILDFPSRVPILDFDFELQTVELVKEYVFDSVYSEFMGSVDFKDDYMLVNFGGSLSIFLDSIPNFIIYDIEKDKLIAEYFIEDNNAAYTVWFYEQELVIPEIKCDANTFYIDSTKWTNPHWSNGIRANSIEPEDDQPYSVSVYGGAIFRLLSENVTTFDCISSTLNNNALEQKLILTPNPTRDWLQILADDVTQIDIYSINGAYVHSIKPASQKISIDDLSNGTYIFKIHTLNGEFTQKITKQ